MAVGCQFVASGVVIIQDQVDVQPVPISSGYLQPESVLTGQIF